MSPTSLAWPPTSPRFPRMSGDEPHSNPSSSASRVFSPQSGDEPLTVLEPVRKTMFFPREWG